jgi:hypothetical protein
MQRRRRATLFATVAVIALILSCGEIREDELWCESAVSHLQDCCPTIDPRSLACVYDSGCGGDTVPSITITASHCIVDRSCETLQSNGACDRIAEQARIPFQLRNNGGVISDEAVCQ